MEFLTSADRRHLFGRSEKTRELLDRIDANVITLLLGNSGSGKTSLIHAGLFPDAFAQGWIPIYTRPLGFPQSDIVASFQASVFEGPPSYRGSLIPLIGQAITAAGGRRLMLVIDQFEDILTARDHEEADRLVADLRAIRYLDEANVRVLVSYRADLEARLGYYWQLISGSPQGLPRVYISGINSEEAWRSIGTACDDLGIRLDLSRAEELQIRQDLVASSQMLGETGVHPPYIQMFIDHIWRTVQSRCAPYRFQDYLATGAMDGVAGGYLTRQLTYAEDREGHIRGILASLVRSYGVKAQKSLGELATDVGLSENMCEVLLERLIDLRLVRHIENQYEVAHDFLAREISAKLVDSEEREFKRFRELLTTKAEAFDTTRAELTDEEVLVLFKHKERVLPSDAELRLILASWAGGTAPGLFWLLAAPASRLLELVRAQEQDEGITEDERTALVLLRRKLSDAPLRDEDWSVFQRYRLASEIAGLLADHGRECPDAVLTWALRSRHRNVRAAATEAVADRVKGGQWEWVSKLRKSTSAHLRNAYEDLVLREDISSPSDNGSPESRRSLCEFALLQQVARARNAPEARASLKALRTFRPKGRSWLIAQGLADRRVRGLEAILNRLRRLGADKGAVLLNPIRGRLSVDQMRALLRAYVRSNDEEARHMDSASYRLRDVCERRAQALAEAVLRTATRRHLSPLRATLRRVKLTPSAQTLALALVSYGSARDISLVIKRVANAAYEVRYWFQIEIARAVGKRMTEIGAHISPALSAACRRKAFWEHPAAQGTKFPRNELLPIRNAANRTLYLRLVAHAVIGAARVEDCDLLCRLARHEFRMISRAAGIRFAALAGDEGIRMLQSGAMDAIQRGEAESLASAIRDAEIEQFGLAHLW
jgi:hypothetical protein